MKEVFLAVIFGYFLLELEFVQSAISRRQTREPICFPLQSTVCLRLEGRNTDYETNEAYAGSPITSDAAFIFLENIHEGFPDVCLELAQYLTCIITNPPCSAETHLPMRICEESCMAYDMLILGHTCDQFTEEMRMSEVIAFRTLVTVYLNFDCNDISTYSFDPNQMVFDNSSCTSLFSNENRARALAGAFISTTMSTTSSTDSMNSNSTAAVTDTIAAVTDSTAGSNSVTVIAGSVGVVGGGVAILCFVLVLIFRKRHARLQRRNTKKMKPVGLAVGRANNWCMQNPVVLSQEDPYENEMPLEQKDRVSYQKLFTSKVIGFEELELGEFLGQGAFGKVLKGNLTGTEGRESQDVAIKTLKSLMVLRFGKTVDWTSRNTAIGRINFDSKEAQREFFAESLIMKDFDHPNVLGLLGVCLDSPNGVPYLVLPFMENGSLKECLKTKRLHVTNFDTLPEDLSVRDLVRMCSDIVQGMSYLASRRFVHRDLAARNCMVSESLQIKVADFGLTRDVYSSDYYRASHNAKLPVKWMPPETLNDAISNEKTDVWAFGVTCWEVFSLGRTPYPGVPNYDILKFISRGKRLEKPALCPEAMFEVLTICWAEKAAERPKFSELVQKIKDF